MNLLRTICLTILIVCNTHYAHGEGTINRTNTILASVDLKGPSGVSGLIRFTLQPGSESIQVNINVQGLSNINSTTSFPYHLHTNPISSDGNCSSAFGHLDPLHVTDSVICDPLVPQYCQIGDLSGRNGKLMTNNSMNLTYIDPFLRMWPEDFSLLGRSVVLHGLNSSRIACGNVTSSVDGTADLNGIPTNMSSTYIKQYPDKPPPTTTVKYEPFIANTTVSAVLGTMTLPAALPNVQIAPEIILSSQRFTQTINGSIQTMTLPVALPRATDFKYSTGAKLPTQKDSAGFTNLASGAGEGWIAFGLFWVVIFLGGLI